MSKKRKPKYFVVVGLNFTSNGDIIDYTILGVFEEECLEMHNLILEQQTYYEEINTNII